QAIGRLAEALSPQPCAPAQLATLLNGFASLPPAAPCSRPVQLARGRGARALQRELALLSETHPAVAVFIETGLQNLHNLPQERGAGWLAGILAAQPYRLAFWRVSGEEINYRRFFDVNELAALRMERREVFDATHALVERLWQS